MYSSVKKQKPSQYQFKSPSAKNINQKKSMPKSQRSIRSLQSSRSQENHDKQIRNLMTSTAYNSVFNRLTKINDLKQFVKQSSQYIEFHQQEVKKYVPPLQSQRRRFSFSLKNSIYCFLERDYRFIRHYFSLLQQQFPQKKDEFRQQIYMKYKDTIIDRKKFDHYFEPGHLETKSNKSRHKSIKKINQFKKEPQNNNKSKQKSSKHQTNKSSKMDKTKIDFKAEIQPKTINNNLSKNWTKSSKVTKSLKNLRQNDNAENNPSLINTLTKKQRRTTQQNIKIIQETLHQIQNILSQSPLSKNFSKKKELYNNLSQKINLSKPQESNFQRNQSDSKDKNTHNQKKDNKIRDQIDVPVEVIYTPLKKKKTIQNPEKYTSEQNQNGDKIYESLIAQTQRNKSTKRKRQTQEQRETRLLGVQINKSKMKSSAKKQNKVLKFDQIFDKNDPRNRETMQMVERIKKEQQKEKQEQKQKLEQTNQLLKTIKIKIQSFKKQTRRSFNEKERRNLTQQQLQIVEFFPQIDKIGNHAHFKFDKQNFVYEDFGQYKEYKMEQILCWPVDDQDGEVFKCLYLKKVANQEERQNYLKDKKELQRKIKEHCIKEVTVLFIEK